MGRTIGHVALALAGLLATAGCSGTADTSNEAVNEAANSNMAANDSTEINTAEGVELNLDATPPQPSPATSYNPPLSSETVTD